jgi:YHS domain-containing protein
MKKKIMIAFMACMAILNSSTYSFAGVIDSSFRKQEPPHLSKKKNYMRVDTSLLATHLDVVCRMNVKNKIVDTMTYSKKLYGFCGTGCKKAFAKSPGTYLKK